MELVNFVNFDFSAYLACVERLWEEHAVFEKRREVPYADYEDFARQALPLACLLYTSESPYFMQSSSEIPRKFFKVLGP